MSQTALTYAAFVCDGNADAAKLAAVCKAAGIDVPAGAAKSFAAILAKKSLGDILTNVSFGGGGAAPAAAPAKGAAAPAAAKKEEKKAESEGDDEMGFGLFD